MTRKSHELALWAALPMAHTSRIEGRLTLTRRVLLLALGVGAAALVPLAMLQPRASAEPKDANGHVRQVLLMKYCGAGWCRTHPDAMVRAARIKPLRVAALYGI